MINVLEVKKIGDKKECYYCGISGFRMTKDHFYPKSKGGNLIVYSCGNCNGLKKDYTPLKWIEFIKKSEHPNKLHIINKTKTLLSRCIYVFKNGIKIRLDSSYFNN